SDAEWSLRAGPHSQLAVVPFSHRGAWFQRRMRDVSDRVLLRECMIRGLHPINDRTNRAPTGTVTLCVLLQIIEQLVITDLPGSLPMDRNGLLRAYRGLQIRCDDPEEVAVTNNCYTSYRLSRFRIAGNKLRFHRRWSDYASVQQTVALHISRVLMF